MSIASSTTIEQTAPEGYAVASEAGYTVGVSVEVTAELRAEGTAREIVHLLQNLRREAGFEIADRISTFVEAPIALRSALEANEAYVREETLSTELTFGPAPEGAATSEHSLNGESVRLGVRRQSDATGGRGG